MISQMKHSHGVVDTDEPHSQLIFTKPDARPWHKSKYLQSLGQKVSFIEHAVV